MGNQTHMAAKIAVNIPHTQNRYILMNGHVIQQIYIVHIIYRKYLCIRTWIRDSAESSRVLPRTALILTER